jgi:hypothetical protein
MQHHRRAAERNEGQAGNLLFLRHQAVGPGGLRRLQGGEHEGMVERDDGLDGAHAAIIRACALRLDLSIKAAPVLDAHTCKV